MNDVIIIKPINKLQEYTCTQSKHDIVPKLPLRGMLLAPSGSGKTVLLSNLILNVYRDCYEGLYIFSPSVNVDQTWQAEKDYQEKIMTVKETPKSQFDFDHYNQEDLQHIIDTQRKVILHMRKPKYTSTIIYISYH